MTETPASDFIRTAAALELLQVTRPTIQRWIKDGTIPFYRVGRTLYFRKSELLETIRAGRG